MRLGKSCRMVLVNCGNWDGTVGIGMGLETVGWDRGRQGRTLGCARSCGMYLGT